MTRKADPSPLTAGKRLYATASILDEAERYSLCLDGRPVKTPLQHTLETTARPLAEAVAAEWQAQGKKIEPETMPMTRLLATALDRVGPQREAITAELLRYAATDLTCFRVKGPADLRRRQDDAWDPALTWLRDALGVRLTVVDGLVAAAPSSEAMKALQRAITALPVPTLTVMQAVAAATGSVVLGMALVHGKLDANAVIAAAEIDERYQNETWGEDAEALDRRRRVAAEIAAAARFLALAA